MEKLTCIERELRRAVESQQYTEVRRLVLSFCQAAETYARGLPPADPRIGEIADLTLEVLQWCRTMVQCSREGLVLELRQIPKVRQYIPMPGSIPPAMHLDV